MQESPWAHPLGDDCPPLLDMPELTGRTRLGRNTVYREIAAGRFPKPVEITPRRRVWLRDEVEDYLRKRIAARRKV